jgi:hypothetical protein
MIQAHGPCCPSGTFNLLHSARSLPPHTQENPRFQELLIFWCQEAFLPTEYRGPALPTVPDNKRGLASSSKSKNTSFSTEGKKAETCYSVGGTRSPVLPRHTESQLFTLHLPAGKSCLSCPRAGISAVPPNGNPLPCWC